MKPGWRILALVTEAFGGRGGIAAVTRDMMQGLAAHPNVDAVEARPLSAPDRADAKIGSVFRQAEPASRPRFVIEAFRAARRLRPSHVYVNHLNLAPLAAAISRANRTALPADIILHVHGIEIWQQPTALRCWGIEQADLVLAVSRDTRRRVLRQSVLSPEQVVVLNNGVGADFHPIERSAARRQQGFGDRPVLLTVGRLSSRERYKGHDQIIETLPKLLERFPSLIYAIAGDGDDRARLEARVADLALQSSVRFLGYVGDQDLPALNCAADLFVMPSRGEGFGIAFLEAMACGTPAVGLDVGGASDALAHGGYALDPEANMFELAASLIEALCKAREQTDEERRDLSSSVRHRFGQERFIGQLHGLLDSRYA